MRRYRPFFLVIGLLLASGCLRQPFTMLPAEDKPPLSEQMFADSLDHFGNRLILAEELIAEGQNREAQDSLLTLFEDLSATHFPAKERLEALQLDTARLLAELLPVLPTDSSRTAGIHSLNYALDQLADSLDPGDFTVQDLKSILFDIVQPEDSSSFCEDAYSVEAYLADSLLAADQFSDSLIKALGFAWVDSLEHPDPLPGIPDYDSKRVDLMVNYFVKGKGRKYYQIWLDRYAKVAPAILAGLREAGCPEDLIFLAMIESGLKNTARSRVSATGTWQFMKGTARLFDLRVDYWVDERLDLEKSTEAACHYLRSLHTRFDDWYLAFASYNWGPGRVVRAIRRQGGDRDFFHLKRMPRETKNYVPTFLAARRVFQKREEYGFDLDPHTAVSPLAAVSVPGALNLDRLATMLGSTEKQLKEWNPHILRFCTAPDGCTLMVEAELAAGLRQSLAELSPSAYQDWMRHKVRRGDTLSGIAVRYGIGLSQILRHNKLSSKSLIRPGQMILVPLPSGSTVATKPSSSKKKPTGEVYRVRRGDALERIARSYHVSLGDLMKWNRLNRADRIYPGQEILVVPPGESRSTSVSLKADRRSHKGNTQVAEASSTRHRVRQGDTAGALARRYGVSLSALVRLNHLDSRARIRTGQVLKIPTDRSSQEKRVIHVVCKGDTLWDLAREYKVRVADIRKWNQISGSRIRPGSQLIIYLAEVE
jgi:membrane-bound lytic murein transglycosylase D